MSHNFVAELWREHDLKPWRQGTFKLSSDPDFEAKTFDVVGLYLDPPEGAIVLSVDEKSGTQALDRVQPLLPLDCGRTEQRTHEYVRHGTTNLFGVLNVGTGEVIGRCFPRRRTKEFLRFMDEAVAPHGDEEIHVVLDNLSTHKGDDVNTWLAKHPKVTFHFTSTGSSWLNQIEIWFGIITRQAIRRGPSDHCGNSSTPSRISSLTGTRMPNPSPGQPGLVRSSQKFGLSSPASRKMLANNT